jgi:hypothetical protein
VNLVLISPNPHAVQVVVSALFKRFEFITDGNEIAFKIKKPNSHDLYSIKVICQDTLLNPAWPHYSLIQ